MALTGKIFITCSLIPTTSGPTTNLTNICGVSLRAATNLFVGHKRQRTWRGPAVDPGSGKLVLKATYKIESVTIKVQFAGQPLPPPVQTLLYFRIKSIQIVAKVRQNHRCLVNIRAGSRWGLQRPGAGSSKSRPQTSGCAPP